MRRILCLSVLIILVLVVLFSSGCHIQTKKEEGGQDFQNLVEIPELIKQANPTKTLTVATLTDKVEYGTMILWANAFMKNNESVQIKVNNNLSSMGDVVNWRTAGIMPDIVWTAGDQHATYSKLGYFEDLRKYAVDADTGFFDDFYSSVIESTHYSDKDSGLWFMPRDYNQLTFYVNKTLLADTGISIPDESWTWADLEKLCQDWKKIHPEEIYFPIEADYSWTPFAATMLKNFGAPIYKDSKLISVEDENLKNAMGYLYDIINNKMWMARMTSGFYKKQSPLMISVRPNLPLVVAATKNQDVSILPFPQFTSADNGRGYVGVGCSGYAICSDSVPAQKQLAWEFLKSCMSEEGYEQVGGYGSIVPALQSLGTKGSWLLYKNSLGNTINNSAFIGGIADSISVNFCNNLQPAFQGVVSNQLMSYFNTLQYNSFDYNGETKRFLNTIKQYN